MMGWDDAAIAAVAILGKLFGGGNKTSSPAATSGLTPDMQALLTQNLQGTAARTAYADPLYKNTIDATNALLPAQYRTHGANQPVSQATSQQMSPDPRPIDKNEWQRRY